VAARAYWKGYLKLSLVSCPIALFPATSEREKISFHQLNKETGNRIRIVPATLTLLKKGRAALFGSPAVTISQPD
jgi:non-homologous end joining protein Ku